MHANKLSFPNWEYQIILSSLEICVVVKNKHSHTWLHKHLKYYPKNHQSNPKIRFFFVEKSDSDSEGQ